MAYNKRQKLEDNVEAIRVALLLEKENRQATPEEREALGRYSGFGGLKFILNDVDKPDGWAQSDRQYIPKVKELLDIIKAGSRDDKESKQLLRGLRNSILSAFYTPKPVIDAISQSLQNAGIEVRTMLDPSSGRGSFVESFKAGRPDLEVTAFEKDLLTGKVLKGLYPDDDVQVAGYETISEKYRNHFDVAASNIPFGDVSAFDSAYSEGEDEANQHSTKAIHNYFFLKTLDNVREGGLVAFITTQGVMDSPRNKEIRKAMMERAYLVGAVRLPNNLFSDEAGTEVGSDLIILQKDSLKKSSYTTFCPEERAFIDNLNDFQGEQHTLESLDFSAEDAEWYHKKNPNAYIFLSEFVWDSESPYLGTVSRGKDQYGKPAIISKWEGTMEELGEALLGRLNGFMQYEFNKKLYDENIPVKVEQQPAEQPMQAVTAVKTAKFNTHQAAASQPVQLDLFGLWDEQEQQRLSMEPRRFDGKMLGHYRDGVIIYHDEQVGVLSETHVRPMFKPLELDARSRDLLMQYIRIRDVYQELYSLEADLHQEQVVLREQLNRYYDEFRQKFGAINERKNIKVVLTDILGRDMVSIENTVDGQFVKSDIFEKPVSFSISEPDKVENALDALFVSLNRNGAVDLDYMSELSGIDREALVDELKDRIFFNPETADYEVRDKYLAGNVIKKIDFIEQNYGREHLDTADDEVTRSYKALLAVRPRQVPFEELNFNFGERWMPKSYFEEFASQLFETPVAVKFSPNLDEFVVTARSSSEKIRSEYAVHREDGSTIDGLEIMRHALYNTVPSIMRVIGYKPNGDPIKGTDHDRMQLAASKIDAIRDAFTEWVNGHDQEWKQHLADMYNRKFNCFVRPDYDGSHQTFPDIDFKSLKSKKNISEAYASQKNAVWMILQNGGDICDHEVGTGKTLIMCMAAHEMKRLGMAHKPIIIGMKANVSEIAATYQAAYPQARVLYASEKDYSAQNRALFFNRMKNNDYDCIIMSHDQFGMIPQSAEIQRDVLQEELDALEEALEVYRQQGHSVSARMQSGLEKRKQNLEAKLDELNYQLSQKADDIVDFKTMGIDHIFVDESQAFKNLPFTTRDNRVAGLGDPKGSQRARNLMYAIRTIQQETGRDLGATFLSGTTISNSLTELYLLFKYLRPQALDAQDIHSFDAWAAVFAQKTRDYEINVAGQVVMKERFRKFIKVPELGAFYNEITDYKTAADVGLDRPEMNVQLVSIPPTEAHLDISSRLLEFANSGDAELIFREHLDDNEMQAKMLIVTNLGKKASLSPKLVNEALYEEGDHTKIGYAARKISEYYHRFNEQKGTQFVFCDLSTPKKGHWSAYQELKDRLVNNYGIPENEVYFMQDAGSEKKREKVIDMMNKGEIRVLFGSTTTLGTGVNAQQRCVAIHHMDLPWRPSDMEQRNGRGVRKGNEVARLYNGNKVDVFIYAVERSLDSYNFYLLQAKSDFIRQMKTVALGKRDFDMGSEDEENGMNFAEYVAITSGNIDLLERAKLEKRVLALEAERKAFNKERSVQEFKLNYIRDAIATDERHLTQFYSDLEHLTGIDKQAFDPEDEEHFVIAETVEALSNDGNGMDMMYVSQFEFLNKRTIDGLAADYGVQKLVNGAEYVVLKGEALGAYLQSLARVEVDGEVMIGSIERNPVKAWITMESIHKKNNETGVIAYLGNKFYVKGEQLKYTWNEGKVNLRDKREASLYIPRAISKIPNLIEDYERSFVRGRQQIAELEAIVDKPWAKADELVELKKQLKELDRKIQTEMDSNDLVRQAGAAKEEKPYTIEQKSYGREPWKLTFKKADYPYLTREDFREMEDKYHGSIYAHSSDEEVEGNFRHQFGAEQTMLELSKLNADRRSNVEWLVSAVRDVHDIACMPAYRRLKEMGYDRYGHPLTEREKNPVTVYSLGDYGKVRDLAHGVKENNNLPVEVAAKAFAKALMTLPDEQRQNSVIIPMPNVEGRRYMNTIARRVKELTGMDFADILNVAEHESLYDYKKAHPGEPLPELFFALDQNGADRLAGRMPIILDNVIDTGHTVTAAMEAFEDRQPAVLVLGHTENYQNYGYPITVTAIEKGLDFIREATPEGVGLTGKSQEELDELLKTYRENGGWRESRALRDLGLDEHSGYPYYLVKDIAERYEEMSYSERRSQVKPLIERGNVESLFTPDEMKHLSEHDIRLLGDDLAFFVGKPEKEYMYKYGRMESLLVVYQVLRSKVDQALGLKEQPKAVVSEGSVYDKPFATQKKAQMAIVAHRNLDEDQVFIQNHSEEERERLRYRDGETYDVYLKRNSIGISDSDRRLYMHDKYTDEQWDEIDDIFKAGFTKDNAAEVGKRIAALSFVATKQEANDILGLNKTISPETALPYFDGVAEHFRSIQPEMSPIMKQFLDLKSKHPDALLLFRCGDFYETYEQDAITTDHILGVSHTYRAGKAGFGVDNPDGAVLSFPHHALDTYLPKLVRAGKRVAICDQLEDPKLTKNLVKRGISELVQPGIGVRMHLVDRLSSLTTEEQVMTNRHVDVLRDGLIEKMRRAGIAVNTNYEEGQAVLASADKHAVRQMAKVVAMNAMTVTMPEKPIEEFYTEGLKPGDSINMQERVLNMSPNELIVQYRRLNGEMLDEYGLNIDEQEEMFRQDYFAKHGLEGFGKALAEWMEQTVKKYTFNKMALRWDVLDRIKELGIEEYIDGKELPSAEKSAEFIRLHKISAAEQNDNIRFFRTNDGVAYGFVMDGKIFIDSRVATAETPLHEYAHLWAEVLRQRHPEEWQNIVQLMKDAPEVWNYVKQNYPGLETDDQIADEALAQFSGKRGYQKLQELASGQQDATSVFAKMLAALGLFWNSVAEFFSIHYTSKEEVADRILFDLLNEVNPLDYKLYEIEGLKEQSDDQLSFTLTDAVNEQRKQNNNGHFIKDRNELSADEREIQQKTWRTVYQSLSEVSSSDMPRRTDVPGTLAVSKSLSGANLGKLVGYQQQLDLLLNEINKNNISREDFINILAGSLGMVMAKDRVSRYTKEPLMLGNGDIVTLRVSNHQSNAFNFILEHSNSKINYGFVLNGENKGRFGAEHNVNYLEINYSKDSIDNMNTIQRREFYRDILNGIQYMLRNGSLVEMPFPDHLNASGIFRKPLEQFRKEHPEMLFHEVKQIESEAFKQWFGNWELASLQFPIHNIGRHPFSGSGKEAIESARKWAKENLARVYSTEEMDGKGEIWISKRAIDKYLEKKAVAKSANLGIHLSALLELPELIRKSVDLEQHPDYNKINDSRNPDYGIDDRYIIHRLYGAARMESDIYRVKITLKETVDKNVPHKAYSYEVVNLEILENKKMEVDIASRKDLADAIQSYSDNDNITFISGAKLLKNVEKSYSNGEKLLSVSQVLTEDGRPLVVEHGTNAEFTVFDESKIGSNSNDNGLFGAGFYFGTHAPAWLDAKHTMKVYLDIKHPFEVSDRVQDMYTEVKEKLDSPAMRGLTLTGFNGKQIQVGEYIDKIKAVDYLINQDIHFAEEVVAKDEELKSIHPDERLRVWREHEIANVSGIGALGLSWQVIISEQIGSYQFTAAAIQDGYDGVIVDRGEGYKEYVAFEPSQIKSATDNIGLFSRQNDDIRFHFIGAKGAHDLDLSDGGNRMDKKSSAPRRLTQADREAGGAMVDQLEKMGIAVHTDNRENRRVLKSAEKDHSETGKVRYMKTENGESYGFAYKGEIYLDPRKIDAELPLHEYAHLWCQALRRINPDNWNSVVEVMKQDADTWNFVKASYPELTSDSGLAEEVIAHYSGKRGAAKLQAELQRMTPRDADYGSRWGNIYKNISKAIQDFWKHVGDSFNIEYKNVDDIADMILKDFADKVSPVKKMERWLAERDKAYADAVENDPDLAAQIFEEALQEQIGNGITPFMAVDGYRGKLNKLAHAVKDTENTDAIQQAVDLMVPLVPPYSVLVPAPSHEGMATDMKVLADALSLRTGMPVADVLKCDPRESQYDYKRKHHGQAMKADQLGVRLEGVLPAGRMPVVIDNVVNSGNTAEACVKALGKGVVLSLASAVSQDRHVASLKRLDPIVYDKDGQLIPLSKRFELKNGYLGKVMHYKDISEVRGERLEVRDEQSVQGLEGYSEEDIIDYVRNSVEEILEDTYPDEDIFIKNITIIGSRTRGEAHDGSDLDILLEYGGKDVREDALFDVLHEADNVLELEGISFDINPINEHYSLNTQQWLERDARWREEDRKKEEIKNYKAMENRKEFNLEALNERFEHFGLRYHPIILDKAVAYQDEDGENRQVAAVMYDGRDISCYDSQTAAFDDVASMYVGVVDSIDELPLEVQQSVEEQLTALLSDENHKIVDLVNVVQLPNYALGVVVNGDRDVDLEEEDFENIDKFLEENQGYTISPRMGEEGFIPFPVFGKGVECTTTDITRVVTLAQLREESLRMREEPLELREGLSDGENQEVSSEKKDDAEERPYSIHFGEFPGLNNISGDIHVDFGDRIHAVGFRELQAMAVDMGGDARMLAGHTWADFSRQEDAERFAERVVAMNTERLNAVNGGESVAEGQVKFHLKGGEVEMTPVSNDEKQEVEQYYRHPVHFHFIGEEGAKNIDLALGDNNISFLQHAKNLEGLGRSAASIKLDTGWEKGVDGKWRLEIPSPSGFFADGSARGKSPDEAKTVRDYLDGGFFFIAYPELQELPVVEEVLDDKTHGLLHFSDDGTITSLVMKKGFMEAAYDDYEAHFKIYAHMMHELQHCVQSIEGFAMGSHPGMFSDKKHDIIEELYEATDHSLFRAGGIRTSDDLRRNLSVEVNGHPLSYYYEAALKHVAEEHGYQDWSLLVDEWDKLPSADQQYFYTAGEVEARNVVTRLLHSEDYLRSTLASETEDVPRERQTVLYNKAVAADINTSENAVEHVLSDFLSRPEGVRYNLLRQMSMDMEYYLNNGPAYGYAEKHLAFGSLEGQTSVMKALYNSFSDEDKPEWITLETIDGYQSRYDMRPPLKDGLYDVDMVLRKEHVGFAMDAWYKSLVNPTPGWLPSIKQIDVKDGRVTSFRGDYGLNQSPGLLDINSMSKQGLESLYDVVRAQNIRELSVMRTVMDRMKDAGISIYADKGLAYSMQTLDEKSRYLLLSNGGAYGIVRPDGTIFIDTDKATAETPIHEYTHLWAEMIRQRDPQEWKHIVELLRGAPEWKEVSKKYGHLKTFDDMAEEVLAHYSGRRGHERLMASFGLKAGENPAVDLQPEQRSLLYRIEEALALFWEKVMSLLQTYRYGSKEEVADQILSDLMNQVNPLTMTHADAERMSDSMIRPHFMGEEGAEHLARTKRTFILDLLQCAKDAAAQGMDPLRIKMFSGWEQGADGKWRYEIGNTKVKNMEIGDGAKLSDVIDAPEVFAAYPELKDIKVVIGSVADSAHYNNETKTITLNKLYTKTEVTKEQIARIQMVNDREIAASEKKIAEGKDVKVQQARLQELLNTRAVLNGQVASSRSISEIWPDIDKVFDHEVQHAIQHIEGFAVGGNLRTVAELRLSRAEAVMSQYQETYEQYKVLEWRAMNEEDLELAMDYYDEKTQYEQEHGAAINAYVTARLQRDRAELDIVSGLLSENNFEEYCRLAGEVEARNVSERRHLSTLERRHSLASSTEDVGREEQIMVDSKKAPIAASINFDGEAFAKEDISYSPEQAPVVREGVISFLERYADYYGLKDFNTADAVSSTAASREKSMSDACSAAYAMLHEAFVQHIEQHPIKEVRVVMREDDAIDVRLVDMNNDVHVLDVKTGFVDDAHLSHFLGNDEPLSELLGRPLADVIGKSLAKQVLSMRSSGTITSPLIDGECLLKDYCKEAYAAIHTMSIDELPAAYVDYVAAYMLPADETFRGESRHLGMSSVAFGEQLSDYRLNNLRAVINEKVSALNNLVGEANRIAQKEDPEYVMRKPVTGYAVTEQSENVLLLSALKGEDSEIITSWMDSRSILDKLDSIEREIIQKYPGLAALAASHEVRLPEVLFHSEEGLSENQNRDERQDHEEEREQQEVSQEQSTENMLGLSTDTRTSYEVWQEAKKDNPQCMLFLEEGDVYLTYGDDARLISDKLELAAVVMKDEDVLMTSIASNMIDGVMKDLLQGGVSTLVARRSDDGFVLVSSQNTETKEQKGDEKKEAQKKAPVKLHEAYQKYFVPEGTSIKDGGFFKLSKGANAGKYAVSAIVNGKKRFTVLDTSDERPEVVKAFKKDISYFFSSVKNGERQMAIDNLVAKYFGQLREGQEASIQEAKGQEQGAKGKKPEAVEIRQGALLAYALDKAGKGVMVNEHYMLRPALYGSSKAVNAFNTLMMALHADMKGYATSQYVGYQDALDHGFAVKRGQNALPFVWYAWDKYVNTINEHDIISRERYEALDKELQTLYKPYENREILNVFNIAQTTFEGAHHDEYQQLLAKQSAAYAEVPLSQSEKADENMVSLYAKLREDNPGSMIIMKQGDSFELYGSDAINASDMLGVKTFVSDKHIDQDGDAMNVVTFSAEEMPGYLAQLVRSGKSVVVSDKSDCYVSKDLFVKIDSIYDHAIALVNNIMTMDDHHVIVNSLLETGFDKDTDMLIVNDSRHSEIGEELATAVRMANDVYREVIAYTGGDERLGRMIRADLLPSDVVKHEALVEELGAAVLMLREGLPATISEQHQALIPYWQRELTENPRFMVEIERSVNHAIEVVDSLNQGKAVNYTLYRSPQYYQSLRRREYGIVESLSAVVGNDKEHVVVVKDSSKRQAAVIMPCGASFEVNNELSGISKNRLVLALRKEGYQDIRFYNAGGGLALLQPNSYFDGKDVSLCKVVDNALEAVKRYDLADEIAHTDIVELEHVDLIPVGDGKRAIYVKAVGMEPLVTFASRRDAEEFLDIKQNRRDQLDAFRMTLGRKYYNLLMEHPNLRADILMPKEVDVNMNRLGNVNIRKDRSDKSQWLLFADIDGRHQQPVKIDKFDAERMWLVSDKDMYKYRLAAQLLADKLGRSEGLGEAQFPGHQEGHDDDSVSLSSSPGVEGGVVQEKTGNSIKM